MGICFTNQGAENGIILQFSENVHELQNMINVVNVCSNEYSLHVNLLKTKVVIFRNRGNIKSEEKWYLNGESIEICNEFVFC